MMKKVDLVCPECGRAEYVCTCEVIRLQEAAKRALNTMRLLQMFEPAPSALDGAIAELEQAFREE